MAGLPFKARRGLAKCWDRCDCAELVLADVARTDGSTASVNVEHGETGGWRDWKRPGHQDRFNVQIVGQRNLHAVAEVAGALPLMFAGMPECTDIDALLGAVDGILLTGARANVHPTCFGVEPNPRHEPYDQCRDAVALPLVKACVDRGVPIFGICRGFQEMNVAFGGSLHPEIRELPGRMNHRIPGSRTARSTLTRGSYSPTATRCAEGGRRIRRILGRERSA